MSLIDRRLHSYSRWDAGLCSKRGISLMQIMRLSGTVFDANQHKVTPEIYYNASVLPQHTYNA